MLSPAIEPIRADDQQIRAMVADADLTSLLPALAFATGDLGLLRDELWLDPMRMQEPDGGWTPEQRALATELAVEGLVRFRDSGSVRAPAPDAAGLHRILEFVTGGSMTEDYVPMLTEELAIDDRDLRAPDWRKEDLAPERPFLVAIVGAGMSGILAAHRLQQAGVPYVVVEKNADVGGTWFENVYPGCRVDVFNHVYCYSFAQKADWPQHHSTQAVLLDYFRTCADRFGIRPNIRFETEVTAITFDDERQVWLLELRDRSGVESIVEANAVVSAVGQLNQPKLPDIDGREAFEGTSFHSARWPADLDLAGCRVAVIGTGASATQLIPHVARTAEHLTVFQRTPNWLIPRPEYQQELPDGLVWLFCHLPGYSNFYRLRLFWRSHEGALPTLERDPDWPMPVERSVSAGNELTRELLVAYLESEFADTPELLEHVIPGYPVGAKRFILDDGVWAETLKRDDVSFVTTPIDRIVADGVVTTDGVVHEAEVLIYGTGFHASEFLTPMKVVGRGGVDLHEQWDGDARAYLGLAIPNFPNFFCLYGPNTNIVVNGSIIYFSECEVHYLVESIRMLLEQGRAAMDVRPEVHDGYNERIDAQNARMAWGISKVNSWYKSESGRVAQNWPFSLLEFWQQTRTPNPADYELL